MWLCGFRRLGTLQWGVVFASYAARHSMIYHFHGCADVPSHRYEVWGI